MMKPRNRYLLITLSGVEGFDTYSAVYRAASALAVEYLVTNHEGTLLLRRPYGFTPPDNNSEAVENGGY